MSTRGRLIPKVARNTIMAINTSQWQMSWGFYYQLFLVVCAAITARIAVSLSGHSGMGKPPMYGDLEAQRHWMEITTNLPVQDWYVDTPENDLQYWGLDYPPLTAFHMMANGYVFPGMMELKGTITVYSILGCPHCMRAKHTLKELDLPFTDIRLDLYPHIKEELSEISGGKRTVPQIFFNEEHIGGNDSFQELVADKQKLEGYLEKLKTTPLSDGALPIPDPETAVKEADPFNFQCEPDEYFLLVNDMRQENVVRTQGGIFGNKYRDAFTGSDFVAWVKNKLGLDEDKAMEMGQALLTRNFARPVKVAEKFIGGTEMYTLTDINDQEEALNNGPISECVPKTAGEIGKILRTMTLKLFSVFLSPDGKSVDYKGIKASEEFQAYKKMTRELIRVNVENATREEKLAFFINVYNAMVIHANIEKGPPTSLWGRYKFFNNTKYIIGTHAYSLQDVENGVLRANRKGVGQFFNPFGKNDPRLKVALKQHEPLIHFALVCGAKSCPPIKTYSEEDINNQLLIAAKSFLEGDEACSVDLNKRTVNLSSIFKWYAIDFGKDRKEQLESIAGLMDDGKKKDDLTELIKSNNFKVNYLKYDWSVNSK